MTDYQKALLKIKSVIKEAKDERDTKGYRENLGYDQRPFILGWLDASDLTYAERSKLLAQFDRLCDAI